MKFRISALGSLLFVTLLFGVNTRGWAEDAIPLPVVVEANSPLLRYTGRFDFSDPKAPRCAWPASAVTLKFKGQAANVAMTGKSGVRWQVTVDGKPGPVLVNDGKPQVLSLAKDLPEGEHTITVLKRTEAVVGTATLTGFQLNEGAVLLQAETPKRRLEVIGDSISAGFGNEAKDQHEKFSPETENAGIAYGALAARAFGAEYVCIAWSGKKLWPDNTIPALYDLTLPMEPGSTWDFSKWIPDVVVINLATNDFGPGNPDEEGWVKAYRDFIGHIRKNYPDAFIFCAVSPMMVDQYSKSKDARTTVTRYITRVVDECQKAGDMKVALVDLPAQTGALGFGAAWHPSARQHENSAEALEKAIHEKLGW
ncbi:SGNH/GDSL hydrolase family protein [soil metagenome]